MQTTADKVKQLLSQSFKTQRLAQIAAEIHSKQHDKAVFFSILSPNDLKLILVNQSNSKHQLWRWVPANSQSLKILKMLEGH